MKLVGADDVSGSRGWIRGRYEMFSGLCLLSLCMLLTLDQMHAVKTAR